MSFQGLAVVPGKQGWGTKTNGHPLIDLASLKLEPNGGESAEVLSLEQVDPKLSRSGRIVLEEPAGRGKTTNLLQLAHRRYAVHRRSSGVVFIKSKKPRTYRRNACVSGGKH